MNIYLMLFLLFVIMGLILNAGGSGTIDEVIIPAVLVLVIFVIGGYLNSLLN